MYYFIVREVSHGPLVCCCVENGSESEALSHCSSLDSCRVWRSLCGGIELGHDVIMSSSFDTGFIHSFKRICSSGRHGAVLFMHLLKECHEILEWMQLFFLCNFYTFIFHFCVMCQWAYFLREATETVETHISVVLFYLYLKGVQIYLLILAKMRKINTYLHSTQLLWK